MQDGKRSGGERGSRGERSQEERRGGIGGLGKGRQESRETIKEGRGAEKGKGGGALFTLHV